jgi:large subunit ribosomal protein L21
MISIISIGNKNYLIQKGDKIKIEKVPQQIGKTFDIADVLMIAEDDKSVILGKPRIKNAKVIVKVLEQKKDDKIKVLKYKAKKRYRKVFGHRQNYTIIEIVDIKK